MQPTTALVVASGMPDPKLAFVEMRPGKDMGNKDFSRNLLQPRRLGMTGRTPDWFKGVKNLTVMC